MEVKVFFLQAVRTHTSDQVELFHEKDEDDFNPRTLIFYWKCHLQGHCILSHYLLNE
jgi:hypothetical protein